MTYINQGEIDEFIVAAKEKLGVLGETIAFATRHGLKHDAETLLSDELIALLDSLESTYLDWSETDVLRYIHYYKNRGDILNPPYLSGGVKIRIKK